MKLHGATRGGPASNVPRASGCERRGSAARTFCVWLGRRYFGDNFWTEMDGNGMVRRPAAGGRREEGVIRAVRKPR